MANLKWPVAAEAADSGRHSQPSKGTYPATPKSVGDHKGRNGRRGSLRLAQLGNGMQKKANLTLFHPFGLGHSVGVRIALIGVALGLSLLGASGADDAAHNRQFLEQVKPLLDSRCGSCHGAEKQKGGLRLDSRAAALKGGETGPAILPGKPAQSLLVQAVAHTKPDLEMPPKDKLAKSEIALLEQWIRDGAAWPVVEPAGAATGRPRGETLGDAWSDPRNPIVKIFGGERLDLWSLRPMRRPQPPKVRRESWVRNPVDQFVLARLEAEGSEPSPEAEKRKLARRVCFDLTGLPPTPEEMAEHLADNTAEAYEKWVDRLLGSPRYGEHFARQWLDVIRYSDSNGFDWDELRKRAWLFRDYVIRSLNADKPFDQFTREQLAGDELASGPPADEAERDSLIATGYLRMGPQDNTAALFNEQSRARAELMADLVETTASAFLGVTMGCCRCHNHKFDPFSQADHFRMRAFFEHVKYADDLPLDLAAQQETIRKENAALDAQIKKEEANLEALISPTRAKLKEALLSKLTPEERAMLELPKEKQDKAKIAAIQKKTVPPEKDILAALTDEGRKDHEQATKKTAALRKEKRVFATGLLMTDAEGTPPITKVLFQGDHKQEREAVEPGFLSALDPNPAAIHKGRNPKTTGRRLTLADWIVSPENPLAARVLANRIWQSHFGRGLVATPNDFGLAGALPSHPELLDWLATETIRGGWSQKRLHRLIVTSATYRQSSEPRAGDAANTLLRRQNMRRLSAEQLRDSLLLVAGRLQEKPGGPPVWPDLPPEILQANPAFLDDNETKTKGWYPSPKAEQNVRSVYLVQKRTVKVPFMETFDLPENMVSCPRRIESIVAPQALSLLNGTLGVEAAAGLAARVRAEAGADRTRQAERAFALALQRPPQADELRACAAFLRERSLVELCRGILNLNEFVYLD